MKKKTNLQTVAAEPARTHRTGPIKEKVQITIRIDQELMQHVYAQIKEDNSRITEIVEEGLALALEKRQHQLPAWTKQVRFVLANATAAQTRKIRGLAIAMLEGEVKKPSPEVEKIYEFLDWFLESRNALVHGAEVLSKYSRYGKSAEDISKMA